MGLIEIAELKADKDGLRYGIGSFRGGNQFMQGLVAVSASCVISLSNSRNPS